MAGIKGVSGFGGSEQQLQNFENIMKRNMQADAAGGSQGGQVEADAREARDSLEDLKRSLKGIPNPQDDQGGGQGAGQIQAVSSQGQTPVNF
ncbi:hypothetical protein PS664_01052 [Pseudomonas fluorescens]|nr:hypothetical protein PS664_01052 [Pseudomonas fluorescens]